MLNLTQILEKKYTEETDYPTKNDVDKSHTEKLKSKTEKLKDEVSDLKSDIKSMQKDLDDLNLEVEDDIGRMSYVRQLTSEFLEYLLTLNNELETQVNIPDSVELMNKILSRSERKRYYMSKFRL